MRYEEWHKFKGIKMKDHKGNEYNSQRALAKAYGMSVKTLRNRLKTMSLEEALTKPVRPCIKSGEYKGIWEKYYKSHTHKDGGSKMINKNIINELETFVNMYDEVCRNKYNVIAIKAHKITEINMNVSMEFRDACMAAISILKGESYISQIDEYAYPKNLMYDLGFDPIDINEMPFDGIEYAISTLSDREQKIIKLRYENYLSYSEIAGQFNVTKERIRQLIAKALSKLSRPSNIAIIEEGVSAVKVKNETRRRLSKVTEEMNSEINAIMQNTKILNQIAKAGGTIDDAKELINKCHSKNKDLCVSIDNLELSVRSYNCLKRSGYNDIIDLVGVTMSDLMTIRNLGRRSLKEIVDKLNEWDITVINE